MNRLRTLFLLSILTALFLWVGQALGGSGGLAIAFGFAVVMNFGAYWFSDRIVLSMYRAQELSPSDAPQLWHMVETLAERARIPMPRLYVLPEQSPNAFATGRNPKHAAVAVTEGLLRALDRDQVAAVIAHELGHIRNRDTLVMSIVATLAGALSMLANMAMWSAFLGGHSDDEDGPSPIAGLLGILMAPIAATLIQMGISRGREFMADEAAARFTQDPLALANGLRRIESWSREIPMQAGSPATAHMFILNPFHGGGIAKLFSTHPPTEERIARLEAMAQRNLTYAA